MEVAEIDRDITCFVCLFGKFRFRRMSFGLTNAPSVFQRPIDTVLVGYTDFASVYIDNIVALGCWKEHVVHFGWLFEALKEVGFMCKMKKFSFGRVR